MAKRTASKRAAQGAPAAAAAADQPAPEPTSTDAPVATSAEPSSCCHPVVMRRDLPAGDGLLKRGTTVAEVTLLDGVPFNVVIGALARNLTTAEPRDERDGATCVCVKSCCDSLAVHGRPIAEGATLAHFAIRCGLRIDQLVVAVRNDFAKCDGDHC